MTLQIKNKNTGDTNIYRKVKKITTENQKENGTWLYLEGIAIEEMTYDPITGTWTEPKDLFKTLAKQNWNIAIDYDPEEEEITIW